MTNILYWIAALGGIGYLPFSGILATILGLLWMYLIQLKLPHWRWILAAQIVLGIIVLTIAPLQSDPDPSVFVLDEFVAAGVLLLATRKWKVLVGGLVLYNLLDATKPVARYVEDLPGGLGIVADDFVSAVVATLCIVLIQYILAHFKTVYKGEK